MWEWTLNHVVHNGVALRGGSYASTPTQARATFRNIAPAELSSPGIGFRVVRAP
ncbi:SUMF1/EgtB/PvdO family nonheme iron enzyme [Actinosynnema sp. NPDC020468]|uniref:SUMF1/EgtB/PvdO family nonheme iron enzyme n=1 Tax=Actinosynnema sp. NPDC020468 TaxID=3154488 RepID=UPI0033E999F0